MNALNIVLVIAIILFARLGVRLFFEYRKIKKTKKKTKKQR